MERPAADARDFIGYGGTTPATRWPNGARLAVSFVLNYEEGGEPSIADGDPASESIMHEIVGAPSAPGRRTIHVESMYEYGSRAGFWRIHRLFTERSLPLTVFAVGLALERNPEAAQAMADAGWEVIGHGWRWIDYGAVPEEVEREDIRRTNEAIRRLTGQEPRGWFTGRLGERTRGLALEETNLLYDSDALADDLPYYVESAGGPHLIVPYSLDCNDFKFLLPNGWVTGRDFHDYLVDTFEQLYAEGATAPRLMNIGLHCRVVGKPGRAHGLRRFLDFLAAYPDVWVTTRVEIARHWLEHCPPG